MQRGVLLFQIDLDDFLRVVPAAAPVRHEDRLEQAEERDADQVADEEVGVEEGQRQGHEEDHDEDVDHSLLRVDRADLHDLLAVADGGFLLVQLDVFLDVDDRPVGAGHHGLHGGSGEPVDHAAAHEETENDLRMDQAQFGDDVAEEPLEQNDDPEDHRRGADDGRADEDRLGRGLEGISGPVGGFEEVFRLLEIGFDAVMLFHDLFGVFTALDHRKLVDRLGVVRYRAEAVHRDGDRPHPEESEGDQTEGEDRRRKNEGRRHQPHDGSALRDQVGDQHQNQDHQPLPEGGEVAGHQAGEDVQRRAALPRGVDDLLAVAGTGAREDLRELGNQRAGDRSATDDDRERKPGRDRVRHGGQIPQQQVAGDKRHDDRNAGGDPDQVGQRMFEIELLFSGKERLADRMIDEIGRERREDHQDTHGEDPDDQLPAHHGVRGHRQREKGDQRDARNAVGFKTVRGGADAVAGVVAGAVGDDARVFRVVFRKMEDDLHEVRTDVGDLGEDASADPQRAGAEGLADRKADEAGSGQILGDVGQDQDHEEELDAHQQQADAHAGTEADADQAHRVAAQRGEGCAGVGHRVDPDAEPGDPVGAEDSHDRAEQDHRDGAQRVVLQADEIVEDADGDQNPEAGQELPLLEQVRLAGFPDRIGDVQHGLVGRQVFRLRVLHPAESHSDQADDEADVQNRQPAERSAHEAHLAQIGQLDVRLSGEGHGGHQKQNDDERKQQGTKTAFSNVHDSILLV